ncbi:MAG: DNA metabolism protein [Clostridia bacterium]|nr:DNA metabolism protein [Clostridia bacterium]
MQYVYDGTFEGLLSCFYAHVYEEAAEDILPQKSAEQCSFTSRKLIVSDESKAEKVAFAIEKKISPYSLRRCYKAYLSQIEGSEMDILSYVFFGFQTGQQVDLLHGNPIVRRMDELNIKVGRESERLRGLLRFQVVCDEGGREILYANIGPDADLIQLLMPHFLNRYRKEPFIIHDVNRKKAGFASDGRWVMRPLSQDFAPEFAESEQDYQNLWKQYFRSAAIKQRINPRCQKNFMPKRYWKYLVENPEEKPSML